MHHFNLLCVCVFFFCILINISYANNIINGKFINGVFKEPVEFYLMTSALGVPPFRFSLHTPLHPRPPRPSTIP